MFRRPTLVHRTKRFLFPLSLFALDNLVLPSGTEEQDGPLRARVFSRNLLRHSEIQVGV